MYRIVSLFIVLVYIIPFTILLDYKYLFEYYQVMIILMSFLIGGFILKNRSNINVVDYSRFYESNDKLLLYTFTLYFIVNFQLFIDVFTHLLIYQDYGKWALENTIKRYAGELNNGILKKISMILFIIYMVFLGSFGFKDNWKRYYMLLFIILIIESSALARAGVLIGFVAYFVEILIRYNLYFTTIKIKKLLKICLIVLIVISTIFFFSAFFRIQNENNILEILIIKISTYIFATYEALYIWIKNSVEYGGTYGFSTFTALYKIFTNVEVQSGFYDGVNTSYGHTVIFTTIRGFLADFGYIVTVFLFFIFGFLIKYFTYHKMTFISYFFIRIILFLLLYIFYSPFLFATVFVAYMLSYFILIVQKIKIARRSRYVQN